AVQLPDFGEPVAHQHRRGPRAGHAAVAIQEHRLVLVELAGLRLELVHRNVPRVHDVAAAKGVVAAQVDELRAVVDQPHGLGRFGVAPGAPRAAELADDDDRDQRERRADEKNVVLCEGQVFGHGNVRLLKMKSCSISGAKSPVGTGKIAAHRITQGNPAAMSQRPPRLPHRPVVLAILDGWGCSDTAEHNAIHAARTPNWDRLWHDNPHAKVDTSGIAVGLPGGQMGNSEVGHLNLGAGRVIYQDVTRISKAIDDGDFFENPELLAAIDAANAAGGAVHVIGLLSPGGVHALDEHLFAMVRLAVSRKAKVRVHALLDGRDMPPRSAEASLEKMQAVCAEV